MKADLHCHSYYSDGESSPGELADFAWAAGADAFSLTDHDTMCGVKEAAAAAEKRGLKFVPGVEISSYESCNVHVLGYNVNGTCGRFKDFERGIAEARMSRAAEMVDRLKRCGMTITMDSVMKFARRSPSRVHVAKALVAEGLEPDIKSCFNKWLREGAPCYIANDFISPVEAVKLITDCGGVAVLAHPIRLKLTQIKIEELVKKLADCGLKGIEASYKFSENEAVSLYSALGKKYGLFITNGGDFHAPDRSKFVPREISEQTCKALGIAK